MKKEYVQQFEAMRDAIQTNVSTIKSLLEQSQKLYTVICELNDDAAHADIKAKLQEAKRDLDEKLEALVKSTGLLYDSYMGLVNKMFG